MDPKKKIMCEKFGLAEDANPDQVDAAYAALSAEDKAAVDDACKPLAAKPIPGIVKLAQPTPEVDNDAKLIALETRRQGHIRQLAAQMKLDETHVDHAIGQNLTIEKSREYMLQRVAERAVPLQSVGSFRVGEDKNIASLKAALPRAIMLKMGRSQLYAFGDDGRVQMGADGKPVMDKLDERSHKLRELRFRDMFREYLVGLRANANDVNRLNDLQLARAMTRRGMEEAFPRMAMLAQGVDDFDSILANVQNKGLRMEYVEMSATWQVWAGRRTTADFKQISDTQLSDVPDLVAKDEHGRYRRVQVSDSKEVWQLGEYGHIVAFTRRALLNDDLNAFSAIPRKEASAARRLEETRVYSVLTTNATMNDSTALFASGHSNYDTATAYVGAPSVTTIGFGRKALRLQTAPKGAILNLLPKFIIGPAALENVIEQYTSSNFVAAISTSINPYAANGRTPLIPVIQPRLDANSATKWYMAADPNQIDTVKICFLESEQEPVLEQNTDFYSDDVEYKVRHSVATAAMDHRGLYANVGA